jgi:hypothetical protein
MRHWPWLVIGLSAVMTAAVGLLSAWAPTPEEPPFVPKEFKAIAAFIPPPQPKFSLDRHFSLGKWPRKPPRVRTPVLPPAIANPMGTFFKTLDFSHLKAKRGAAAGVAQLGLPKGPSLSGAMSGVGFDDSIGQAGARIGTAGAMTHGSIGKGSPQGRVLSATPRPDLSTKGSIDRDALRKVIDSHSAEISDCYERAMIAGGSFGGKMVVEWAIDAAGRASKTRVVSTDVKSTQFAGCVLQAIGRWQYPSAHDRVVVRFPFHVNAVGY